MTDMPYYLNHVVNSKVFTLSSFYFLATTIISGIFPHALNEMLGYCCPKSKITYGKLMASIAEIENHFSSELEIDLAFPLHGKLCEVNLLIQYDIVDSIFISSLLNRSPCALIDQKM